MASNSRGQIYITATYTVQKERICIKPHWLFLCLQTGNMKFSLLCDSCCNTSDASHYASSEGTGKKKRRLREGKSHLVPFIHHFCNSGCYLSHKSTLKPVHRSQAKGRASAPLETLGVHLGCQNQDVKGPKLWLVTEVPGLPGVSH